MRYLIILCLLSFSVTPNNCMESDEENEKNCVEFHFYNPHPILLEARAKELRELLKQPNPPKNTGLELLMTHLTLELLKPPSPEPQTKHDDKKKKQKKKKSHK